MKKSNLFKAFLFCFLALGTVVSFSSCSDDDDPDPTPVVPDTSDRTYYHVVLGVGDDGNDGTLAQMRDSLTGGSAISFNGYGFEIPSTRTARVTGSETGKYLYSLDYGGGTITKYLAGGGHNYYEYPNTNTSTLVVSDAIGTTNPRWGKVNEDMALLHNISTTRIYKDAEGTDYDYTAAYAALVGVELGGDGELEMGSIQNLEIPRSAEDIEKDLHIWRIDAPVVHNGKVYYGVAKRSYNPTTGSNVTTSDYATTTLVADYPSLNNLKTIESTLCKGANYGYRTPVNHVDEKGDIYQLSGDGVPARLLKISNEAYDNSYNFDLSAKLGVEVGALGWFYAGNGIGYVPFYDLAAGQSEAESAWGIARVDLYKQSVVKMNIPYKLWLRQYQNAVLEDGKLYMALAPVGASGAIYIFDTTSESANGFTVGTELENLAGQFYIGVY